jgi:hypothetical protein
MGIIVYFGIRPKMCRKIKKACPRLEASFRVNNIAKIGPAI